jgi:hypothetical protein
MTEDDKKRDKVLERLLNTPPTPHKEKDKKRDGDQERKARKRP